MPIATKGGLLNQDASELTSFAGTEIVLAHDDIHVSRVIPMVINIDSIFSIPIPLSIYTDFTAEPYEVHTWPRMIRIDGRDPVP